MFHRPLGDKTLSYNPVYEQKFDTPRLSETIESSGHRFSFIDHRWQWLWAFDCTRSGENRICSFEIKEAQFSFSRSTNRADQ